MSTNLGDMSTSAASTSLENSRVTAGRSPEGEPVAPGWTRYYDPEGKPYYLNHSTNKTQWDPPPELSMAPAPPAAPQRYEQRSQAGPFASTSGSHYSGGMYGAPGTSMPQSMAPHGAAPGGFPGFEYSMGAAGAYQSPPMMGVASGGGMALPSHMTLNPGAGYGGQAVPQQVFLQPSMGGAPTGGMCRVVFTAVLLSGRVVPSYHTVFTPAHVVPCSLLPVLCHAFALLLV